MAISPVINSNCISLFSQDNPENKYAVGVSIAELKTEDSGNYYCKGNNSHGDETQHFQLVIVEASHKVCNVEVIH